MNIIVCIKRVPETAEAEVKIDGTGQDIVRDRLTFDINEADNYALEEALLMKEEHGGEVTLLSMGDEDCDDTLRMGLAKGADEAIRLDDPAFKGSDGFTIARILAAAIEDLDYDLILTGCMASDDGYTQVGPALAENLGIPHATMAINVELEDQARAVVQRELEGGLLEKLDINLPAVITIQTGINEPRYASILGIGRASKREIKLLSLADLDLQENEVGDRGSGSHLEKLSFPEVGEQAEILKGTPDEAASKLAELIKERGLL